MKSILMLIALVLAVGAAGVAGYGYFVLCGEVESRRNAMDTLNSRMDAAENTIHLLKEQTRKASELAEIPQVVEKDIAALREEVARVGSRMETLGSRIDTLSQSERKQTAEIARLEKTPRNTASGATSGSMVSREDVEKLIEQKIRERQPQHGQPPELSAVAQQLELDEVEKKALENIIRKKKNEQMELLKTPRADGSNLLDEFAEDMVAAFSSEEPRDQATRKAFMKLQQRVSSENVPGTEITYAEAMNRKRDETRQAFKETLSQGQYQAFEAMGINNPMDLRIPDDPMGTYIHQHLKAAGVLPEGPQPPGR